MKHALTLPILLLFQSLSYSGNKEQYRGCVQDRGVCIHCLCTYSSHNMNPKLQTHAMHFIGYFGEPFSTSRGRPPIWVRDHPPPFVNYIKSFRVGVSTFDLSPKPKKVHDNILHCRDKKWVNLLTLILLNQFEWKSIIDIFSLHTSYP